MSQQVLQPGEISGPFGAVGEAVLEPARDIFVETFAGWRRVYVSAVKPVMDRALGMVLCLLVLPVLLVVSALVRLKLGPGVLYTQKRVGLHGRAFTLYKFRTMHPDR